MLTRSVAAALLAMTAVLAIGVDSTAGPRRAKRFGLRPPRRGAWQVEAPLDHARFPDMLQIPDGHAVSRFWKCDREGKLIAEVACFDGWPDCKPDPYFGWVVGTGGDSGIMPSLEPSRWIDPGSKRYERKMDLAYLIFEMTSKRKFIQVSPPCDVRWANRRWGALLRKSGSYQGPDGTRWDIGVEAVILGDGSEVMLVYRVEAGHTRRKTRAQIEEILNSLHVVKPI